MDETKDGVKVLDSQAPGDQKGQEIDYAAELAKEREEKENYKKGMLNAKDMLKGKGIITDPDDIMKLVDAKVEEKMNAFTSNFAKSTVESTLSNLASSDAEKELIKYHYDNSIVKSGLDPESVRNDLENAKLLANKKAFFKQTEEMKIALSHKAGMSSAGMGSSQEAPTIKSDEFFSVEQINQLRKQGYDDKKIELLKKNMQKAKER